MALVPTRGPRCMAHGPRPCRIDSSLPFSPFKKFVHPSLSMLSLKYTMFPKKRLKKADLHMPELKVSAWAKVLSQLAVHGRRPCPDSRSMAKVLSQLAVHGRRPCPNSRSMAKVLSQLAVHGRRPCPNSRCMAEGLVPTRGAWPKALSQLAVRCMAEGLVPTRGPVQVPMPCPNSLVAVHGHVHGPRPKSQVTRPMKAQVTVHGPSHSAWPKAEVPSHKAHEGPSHSAWPKSQCMAHGRTRHSAFEPPTSIFKIFLALKGSLRAK
ncbi:hypothetical protein VNO80_34499 [Phaseolus coccineus]|uniref:Uncharacterized protein n=1 Tax=Phaseolus coccineus TaxID=3886 RepID=A0AAN9KQI9_PHACN